MVEAVVLLAAVCPPPLAPPHLAALAHSIMMSLLASMKEELTHNTVNIMTSLSVNIMTGELTQNEHYDIIFSLHDRRAFTQ